MIHDGKLQWINTGDFNSSTTCLKVRFAVYTQVLGIHLNKWRLDFKLGVYVLVLYAVFLCFSVMIEYNVFTFVNLPMCIETESMAGWNQSLNANTAP